MTHTQHVPTDGKNVRAWTHGQLHMPDWIPRHMAGGIEANGTFEIMTDVGHIRVHPGNVIVERGGAVWVCERGEADTLIERLELHADQAIPNIGPGKAHQFGSGGRSVNKENTGIMSQPELDFDPDRLVTVLQTRKADEWGLFAAGLHGGDRRVEALRDAIMTAYRRLSAAA